ncbi:preprotein translocase subunit YajC [Lacipirellula parvula]|uniref:Sec translocon accessory complex subunit YajC n=1 Tax=Lacipirellula parvula TaxID=2650471 RepID=A0A5K7XKF0_9BACT|nr:preprotein translocase subunit YajC [Lacipirellula parvula]BBO34976.1 protein translocase subunit YajC [Lacipirellula parvula]
MEFTSWGLLAQAETAETAATAEAPKAAADGTAAEQPGSPFGSLLVPLSLIMVLFYFVILRPQKAKDQQFKSLLDSLKETDRVVTIGGIHGVVTNVQRNPDGAIVTIRVDESTGAKIRVGASAIARVLTDEEKSA